MSMDGRDSSLADVLLFKRETRVEPVSFTRSPRAKVRSWAVDDGGAGQSPFGGEIDEDLPDMDAGWPAGTPGGDVAGEPVEQGPCERCEEIEAEAEEARRELVARLREPYLNAAARLEQTSLDLTQWVRRDVVRLAVRLAETIVHRAVQLDPTIAEETVARALSTAGGVERATVFVHRDDLEAIAARVPELAAHAAGKAVHVDVRASDEVDLGGCIVKFDEGTVDARWHAQLLQLRDLIDAVVVAGPADSDSGGER